MNKSMSYDLDTIDMKLLNEVRSIMGKRWPEMVEVYLENTAAHIENIKHGFAQGDKKSVAASSHPLKSTSNSMGIMGLYEIARTIEYETKDAIENDSDISHLQELVPLLEESLKRIIPRLHATLENICLNPE